MMDNICNGTIIIPEACNIDIASNGTLMVFTDMVVTTTYFNFTQDFNQSYYYMNKILSRAHNLLSNDLLAFHTNYIKISCRTLMNYFFIFLFISLILFLFYGTPITNLYL
jgi:hypothetical protein